MCNKEELLEVDNQMRSSAPAWMLEVSPLILSEPGGGRNNEARRQLKHAVVMTQHYDKKENIVDELLLSKVRFKAWTKFWNDKTDSGASSDFEDLYEQQG